MAEFTSQQPALTAYLLVADENLGDEAKESQLIPLAVLIWDSLRSRKGHLRPISETTIEEAEAANVRFLEQCEAGSEMNQQAAAESLLSNYNQYPLLTFAIEVLMQGNEDAPELAPERIGFELLHLKTIIDCMDNQ